MNPREVVFEVIHHHQTPQVPYTLGFEGHVDDQLDAYYGGPQWRERLVKYITGVAAVNTDLRIPIDDAMSWMVQVSRGPG
jgi:hypothetical protein